MEVSKKKLFQKKLSKTFGGYDKISYLCIRFLKRTAIVKRAIFEQIYINNTSSTRARLVSEKETVLGKIKRTVITY